MEEEAFCIEERFGEPAPNLVQKPLVGIDDANDRDGLLFPVARGWNPSVKVG